MAYLNTKPVTVTNTAGGTIIHEGSKNHTLIQNPSTSPDFVELFFGQDTQVVLGQGVILEPSDIYVIATPNNQKIQGIANGAAPITLRTNIGH